MNIVIYPNAKINIGLKVLNRREDGYHNIETLFAPLMIKDILEIVESNSLSINYYGHTTGMVTSIDDDLCIKAYKVLKKDYDIPPVNFHLYKNIAIGGGLGGGSSDAAFTLQGLNSLFSLGLNVDTLVRYASMIGSDCPFFIHNKPMFGEGRGEILSPFSSESLDLIFGEDPKYEIRVETPLISVSTAEAYRAVKTDVGGAGLKKLLSRPIEKWREIITNDFEPPIFALHPEIKDLKDKFYSQNAIYASMSGSGSSVFGIFEK